jgi:hypothetical protein
MIHRILFALPIIALIAAGPALADCASEVARTDARVASLERKAPDGATGESWFGEPNTPQSVRKLLDGAKDLAADGKEEACVNQLGQARSVLRGLESKHGAQEAERERKTDAIRNDLKDGAAPGKTPEKGG